MANGVASAVVTFSAGALDWQLTTRKRRDRIIRGRNIIEKYELKVQGTKYEVPSRNAMEIQ
jgi:hypothetical protein